jgi:hypothetical protein
VTKKDSQFNLTSMIGSLYEARRKTLGRLNIRNTLTMVFAASIVAILAGAFAQRTKSVDDWRGFVEKSKDIQLLDPAEVVIKVSSPSLLTCDASCLANRGPNFSNFLKTYDDLTVLNRVEPMVQKDNPNIGYWANVNYTIPASELNKAPDRSIMLSVGLSTLRYRSAYLFVNGTFWSRLSDSEPLVVRMHRDALLGKDLNARVSLNLFDRGNAFDPEGKSMPPYIAPTNASRNLEKFLILDRDTRGKVIGTMSRVMIAVFALFLFIVIVSTPEVFGLAMFLGCEAAAIVLGEKWIDLPASPWIIHYFYQMGDIFRLYFFIQISRMFKPNTAYWILTASVLSIPYGYFRYKEQEWNIAGLEVIPRLRDFVAGSLGTLLCLAALFSIRSQKIPWRKTALLLGALCSFQQVLGPISHYWPELNKWSLYNQFFTTYEAIYTYLGVLSALTNISTLEGRVNHLSKEKAHGDMIEQELTLGQAVQRSFLKVPKLSKDYELAHVHDAAVYVSGDIFFTHYNESLSRLTILLCDLTGHGVQAALKATACYMLAKNTWDNPELEKGSSHERFLRFHNDQQKLLKNFSDTPDIPTFLVLEFNAANESLSQYRVNFHPILIVEPSLFGGWTIADDFQEGHHSTARKMSPGSLIATFSDGYVASSRQYKQLVKYLQKHLASFDGSAASLRDLIVNFDQSNLDRPIDDRTLVVLSWKRSESRKHQALVQSSIDFSRWAS